MTPKPTVIDEPQADTNPSEPAWVDKAASVAFGGQSSDDAAEPAQDNGSLLLLFGFVGAILAIGFLRSWWIPGLVAGLLFMLFMHELGHYLTARASGMKVTEFFLGFGPKIWSFNKGETEYGVKAIPAGAYVRIMGMTNLDDIDPAEEHRAYRSRPYWQRMMTICAGSAMHFVMATVAIVVLFTSYNYQGFNGPPWFVNQVVEGSTASTLGIERGDQILSINDETFDNWDQFGEIVSNLEEGPVDIVINRDGEQQRLQGELGLRPRDVLLDGFGLNILLEDRSRGWEVGYVWPTDPADRFGLELADIVLGVDGTPRPNETQVAAILRENEGETITIEVLRDGEPLSLEGVVELNSSTPFRGFFGVGPTFVPRPEPGVGEAIGRSVNDFGVISKTNLAGIYDLINPAGWLGIGEPEVERRAALVSPQSGGAPIPRPENQDTNRPLSIVGIGKLMAQSESADQVLFLFAVVNIFIGIFNLVPLLPLDGGHAAIATYERARGLLTRREHRVDAAKLIPVTWAVILLLVGVGVWTLTLDIFAWPA